MGKKYCILYSAFFLMACMLFSGLAMADSITYDPQQHAVTVTCDKCAPDEAYSFIATRGADITDGLPEDKVLYLNQFHADSNGVLQVLIVEQNLRNVHFYIGGNLSGAQSPHLIGIYGEISSQITLPQQTLRIEDEAFAGGRFQAAYLGDQLESIGKGAFRDCTALVYVQIPPTVTDIAEDAFDGCGQLTIGCVPGSTAYQFAQDHGFSTEDISGSAE